MMKRSPLVLIYGASFAASISIFWVIRYLGHSLVPPVGNGHVLGVRSDTGGISMRVLLALLVVIVVARVISAVFGKLNQPEVTGEVVAGILLGSTFLGWVLPGVASQLFSGNVVPHLAVISQLGVVFYMFLVGLELDTELLRQRTNASIAISHASI